MRCVTLACNAILTTADGSATLSNYGLRRNCSVLFVYPELIDIVRMDVGQITAPRVRTASARLPAIIVGETQRRRQFHTVSNSPLRINYKRNWKLRYRRETARRSVLYRKKRIKRHENLATFYVDFD